MYPAYIGGFIFSFLVTAFVEGIPGQEWLNRLWQAKWEILLLNICGIDNGSVLYNCGGAPAYISALLISSLVLFYLIRKHKELFVCVIAPLILIGGSGRIINVYGNLSQWLIFDGWFDVGLIRAFMDMSAGAVTALVVMPKMKLANKWIIASSKLVVVISILGLVVKRAFISYSDMILYIFIFCMAVSVLWVTPMTISEKMNDIFCFLGEISYPIFLWHYGVLLLLKKFFSGMNYWRILLIFIISILIAGVVNSLILRNVKKSKSRQCKERY